jgi:pyridoxal phosphate enzyme (YggS family)
VISIAKNIEGVLTDIRRCEQLYGRPEGSVRLLAVSKKQEIEKIAEAAAAGLVDFGENYLQEGLEKIRQLSELKLTWHFIGPIQSNKTRGISEHFHWVHSVDRVSIAQRLNNQRPEGLLPLNVCVQVNVSNETAKSGTTLESTVTICEAVNSLPQLRLRGLMAIPAAHTAMAEQRASFEALASEFKRLQTDFPTMDTLSMGMSGDFEAAIAEGSTMIRIGTGLFGQRPS